MYYIICLWGVIPLQPPPKYSTANIHAVHVCKYNYVICMYVIFFPCIYVIRRTSKMPPSLQWGLDHEKIALQQYQELHSVHVEESGLWIDIERGWLASSPDGLIRNEKGEVEGIVEIKCPFSARELTPSEASEKLPCFPSRIQDGQLALKKKHDYFFQVQGQLAITHAKWCDFCIFTPLGLSVERITFDENMWKQTVQTLDQFFEAHMLPLLVSASLPDNNCL